MKEIIDMLKGKLSLEEEFELERQILKIKKQDDVKELKEYAIELLTTGCKQGHFISLALEIIIDQQEQLFKFESIKKTKKATFLDRLIYVLFDKK
tara:strand:+ start:797 stop:1081 length:285 start_codon:yes stop_codon:yes gene_type:complete